MPGIELPAAVFVRACGAGFVSVRDKVCLLRRCFLPSAVVLRLVLAAALLLGSTTALEAKIVYVPLYIVDTQSDVREPKRAPALPLFITQDGRTFAQLSSEEKDKISHRGNAIKILKKELEKRLGEGNLC